MQNLVFTIAVTLICRAFALRDMLLGRLRHRKEIIGVQISRHEILRETHTLDSVFVSPVQPPTAALLICHGIGEVVENWQAAQQLLALHGVASLVFDYSGFGKPRTQAASRNDVKAEQRIKRAGAIRSRMEPAIPLPIEKPSKVMGAPGTSVCKNEKADAASSSQVHQSTPRPLLPRAFASVLPPIWSASKTLSNCSVPVLIVHCERDRASPVRMARELASLCGPKAELVIVPEQAHNEASYDPKLSYWHYVLDHIASDGSHSPGTST